MKGSCLYSSLFYEEIKDITLTSIMPDLLSVGDIVFGRWQTHRNDKNYRRNVKFGLIVHQRSSILFENLKRIDFWIFSFPGGLCKFSYMQD